MSLVPDAVDQPGDQRIRVDTVPWCLDVDLGQDLPDRKFVEVRRQHDRHRAKPGSIQETRRLDAEVGKIAAVEADADRFVPCRPAAH